MAVLSGKIVAITGPLKNQEEVDGDYLVGGLEVWSVIQLSHFSVEMQQLI